MNIAVYGTKKIKKEAQRLERMFEQIQNGEIYVRAYYYECDCMSGPDHGCRLEYEENSNLHRIYEDSASIVCNCACIWEEVRIGWNWHILVIKVIRLCTGKRCRWKRDVESLVEKDGKQHLLAKCREEFLQNVEEDIFTKKESGLDESHTILYVRKNNPYILKR